MSIGENQIGTEGARLRRSSQCVTLTGAIPATGLILDITIPRLAMVDRVEFYTSAPTTGGSETIQVGWTAGQYELPGTQTGLVDEAADADGIGTLTNAQLRSGNRAVLTGGATLQKKRFTAPVKLAINPSAQTTQNSGDMIFKLFYVVD